MAAASGIPLSPLLLTTFASSLSSSSVRLLKISITDETLVCALEVQTAGKELEGDWDEVFRREGVVVESEAAFYLVRLTLEPSSQWVFYTYIPSSTPVRSRMVYASSRAGLLRGLGDSRFSVRLFASSKSELSYSSYVSQIASNAAPAPLTDREKELAEIRSTEASEQVESTPGRSMIYGSMSGGSGASVGLPWSEGATSKVKTGLENVGDLVQLEVETVDRVESVILSPAQPTSVSLPLESPCWLFYRHAYGIVFIYSCPPLSPIKSRLLYSSSTSGITAYAKSLGITLLTKIETSEPEEINAAFIDAEVAHLAPFDVKEDAYRGTAPIPATAAFARPSRPGRKR